MTLYREPTKKDAVHLELLPLVITSAANGRLISLKAVNSGVDPVNTLVIPLLLLFWLLEKSIGDVANMAAC